MKWLNALFKFLPRVSRLRSDLAAEAWWRSRTIISNILTLISDVAVYFWGHGYGIHVDEVAALSVAVVAASNIVMRLLSGRPLALQDIPRADSTADAGTR